MTGPEQNILAKQVADRALQFHRAGKLIEAEAAYQQVLEMIPNHPDLLFLLGTVRHQLGRNGDAVLPLQQAVAGRPHDSNFHKTLAAVLFYQKQLGESLAECEAAIACDSKNAEAYFILGCVHEGRNQRTEAIGAYRKSIAINPGATNAHNNLGLLLLRCDDIAGATIEFETVTGLANSDDAWCNLGDAHERAAKHAQAIASYRRSLQINPYNVRACTNLSRSLLEDRQLEQAAVAAQRAILLDPQLPAARRNLADSLLRQNRFADAVAEYQQLILLQPEDAEVHNNLGAALNELGELDAAIEAARVAITLRPDFAEAFQNEADAFWKLGRPVDASQAMQKASDLKPSSAELHSNVVFSLCFDPAADADQIYQGAKGWATKHADPVRGEIRPPIVDRTANRKLRIGYVSGDFRNHPVGRFMVPIIEHHDRRGFEIHCFSNVQRPHESTNWFRSAADRWHDISQTGNADVAELIRGQRIDILIDLSVHGDGNRLPVFARKPAAIQTSYLGYCSTTGLDTIDYLICDQYLIPEGAGAVSFAENPFRLPGSYWCYRENSGSLPVIPLPALSSGQVTFGCMNQPAKLSSVCLELWARILLAVPHSRLILHVPTGSGLEQIRAGFIDSGVDPDRIVFYGRGSLGNYLQLQSAIDIALDPFPFTGGTTTCDALWMGAPVVTLSGQTSISRGGLSILSTIGLPELVARSVDQYLQIAIDLAADLPRLSSLRQSMRDRMRSSPLMSEKTFVADLEAAYRSMWARYLESAPAEK